MTRPRPKLTALARERIARARENRLYSLGQWSYVDEYDLTLSNQDRDTFLDALANPLESNDALKQAAERWKYNRELMKELADKNAESEKKLKAIRRCEPQALQRILRWVFGDPAKPRRNVWRTAWLAVKWWAR